MVQWSKSPKHINIVNKSLNCDETLTDINAMWKINNNNDYIKASNSPDCKLSLKRFSKGSCSVKARLAVRPLRTSKPSQNDITFYTSMNTIFFLFFYELMLSNIFHAKMVGVILWHHSPGNSHSMTDLSAYLLDKAVVSSKRIFLFIFDLCHLFLLGFLSSVYDWWNAFFLASSFRIQVLM